MKKIKVEPKLEGSDVVYYIRVYDEELLLEEKKAHSLSQRDEIVWDLAEMFETTDIEIIKTETIYTKSKGKPKLTFKYTEIPSIPVLDKEDADEYFDNHEDEVYERIVVAVGEGIKNDLNEINLFELNGTGVYITSERPTWISGLGRALKYYEDKELFEKCITIRDLLQLINTRVK